MVNDVISQLEEREELYIIETWGIDQGRIAFGPITREQIDTFLLGVQHKRYHVRRLYDPLNCPEYQAGTMMREVGGKLAMEITEEWAI